MVDLDFEWLLRVSAKDQLIGVALVDRDGKLIASHGDIAAEEAMPLAALLMHHHKSPDLAQRMFDGELLTEVIEGREIVVGIARRQLFVVAVLPQKPEASVPEQHALRLRSRMLVEHLRGRVESMLAEHGGSLDFEPWRSGGGTGGSGSGPAEIPLIEFGVTVPRSRGNN